MNDIINARPQWKTNQPVESSLTDIRMALDQLWMKSDEINASFDEISALLNTTITQKRMLTLMQGIKGHSSEMPDLNGQNQDHDRRYVTRASLAGISGIKKLNVRIPPGDIVIASAAITIIESYNSVDTEGAAASDDLETISGGTAGDIIFIKAANTARTVVLKHGTGNIYANSGSDLSLDSIEKMALLIFNGTNWILFS